MSLPAESMEASPLAECEEGCCSSFIFYDSITDVQDASVQRRCPFLGTNIGVLESGGEPLVNDLSIAFCLYLKTPLPSAALRMQSCLAMFTRKASNTVCDHDRPTYPTNVDDSTFDEDIR